jgi:hypothetical protein
MKEAIAEYRKLGQDKLIDLGIANNLAFALFYGGDSDGAIKAAQTLNPSAQRAACGQRGRDCTAARPAWRRPTSAPATTRPSKTPRAPPAKC